MTPERDEIHRGCIEKKPGAATEGVKDRGRRSERGGVLATSILKVCRMPSAPIPGNEHARLLGLRSCGLLDTPSEPAFDNLTALACRVCGAPIAIVSLIDEGRQWFKSVVGLDVRETPREQAFCAWAILGDDIMVVPDARGDPRFEDNPLVTGSPGMRFYAGVPLRLSTGAKLGTLCVIDTRPRNVTPEWMADLRMIARQAEAQLELRYRAHLLDECVRAAQEAARAKSSFVANMSHELRTPLTAITGFVDLIGDASTNEAQRREYLGVIRRNGEHLLGLLNNVLDHAKIEAGSLEPEWMPCVPATKLSNVRAIVVGKAHEKGVNLTVEARTELPERFITDRLRLRQILINLVSNAIKFTPEGGSVSLEAFYTPSNDTLHFSVRDTGIGMTAEQIAGLFKPFSQAESSTSRRFGGTGLGLSISKSLAELLGGRIKVESESGRGSTFTLELPARSEPGVKLTRPSINCDQTHFIPEDRPDETVLREHLAGHTVLLVEDGLDNQRLISLFLRRAGAEVETAVDGVKALAAYQKAKKTFSIILLDIQMPVMDGYQTIRLLRQQGATMPIIALTANATKEERDLCRDAGFDDFATKPIERQKLIELCGRWAGQEAKAGA